MKPYPVTVQFWNQNRRMNFLTEFDNIGAARTFVSNAPISCKNFILLDSETNKEIERHRFDELPFNHVAVSTDATFPKQEFVDVSDPSVWLKDAEAKQAETAPSQEVPEATPATDMCSDAQRRALFGVIITEYARQKKMAVPDAQEWLKNSLIKRGMIKDSRTELTKADATKVIDGMCKMLGMELDGSWV